MASRPPDSAAVLPKARRPAASAADLPKARRRASDAADLPGAQRPAASAADLPKARRRAVDAADFPGARRPAGARCSAGACCPAGARRSAGACPPSRWERVWRVVRRIPRGRVATYGQIAALAGLGRNARQAGYALHALPHGSLVPWHRVINARGAISLPPMRGDDLTQRMRLEKEGVRFDARGRVDLARFGWRAQGRRAVRE